MLTQANKDFLELTDKQYDYIELLLTRSFLDWKLAMSKELQEIFLK